MNRMPIVFDQKRILVFTSILLFVFSVVFFSFIFFQKVDTSQPKVIIRFDDYGIWCNEDWIKIEEQLLVLHKKYNVKITFSVIPFSKYPPKKHVKSPSFYPKNIENENNNPYPLNPGTKRVSVIKESADFGISEIALHGYYHPKGYTNTKNSEFFGVSYDEQLRKIKEGKARLDSLFNRNIIVFVPPHNTYDFLTLDALQEYGIKCISAKPLNYDAPYDKDIQLGYIWYTMADSFQDLLKRFSTQKYGSEDPVDVLLLHHTSFTDENGLIDNNKLLMYEEFLKKISENNISSLHFSVLCNNEKFLFNNESIKKSVYLFLATYNHLIASKFVVACKTLPVKLILMLTLFAIFAFGFSICMAFLIIADVKYMPVLSCVAIVLLLLLLLRYLTIIVGNFSGYSVAGWSSLLSIRLLAMLCAISVLVSFLSYMVGIKPSQLLNE